MQPIIFEEHSSVLQEWKKRGIQGKTLIYLDAHIDVQLVSQKRIEALEQCRTAAELAKLEKPHHTLPDMGYSYSIEDFLYPAYRLGMISRLIWVGPPPNDQENGEGKTPEEFMRMLESMEGVSLEDLSSFQMVDNMLTGKLLGLDMVACQYTDLVNLELPADSLIDIDIDYFVELPADEPWIDPQAVFTVLKQLPLTSDFVTLTRSVSSGYTPLRYRFFADYLAALWQGDNQLSSHYSRLFNMDEKLRQGNTEAAREGCIQELEKFPECAATYYLLSLIETNSQLVQSYQNKAGDLDVNFRHNVLRSICQLDSRELKFDENNLKELENQLETSETTPEELAISHLMLGILSGKLGNFRQVFKHHQIYNQKMGNRHPKLDLILGQLLLYAGYTQRATTFLQAALEDEISAGHAHSLLGTIYAKQGNLKQACEHFLPVSELMPVLSPPVKVLAKIYRQMGDEENYQAMSEKYRSLKMANLILSQKIAQSKH
ncbi:MAG: hypothetical protein ACKPBV_19415 [Sphaerospermopsis kisseleviana]